MSAQPTVRPDADVSAALEAWAAAGVRRGQPMGLAVESRTGAVVVGGPHAVAFSAAQYPGAIAAVDAALRPRWVWWCAATTAGPLADAGRRLGVCWDLAAVHRLLAGGSTDDAGTVWAALHGLDAASRPRTGQLDLLAPAASAPPARRPAPADDPCAAAIDGTGHLRAEWVDGGWARDLDRLTVWATLALRAQLAQHRLLHDRSHEPGVGGDPLRTAFSESAAALLCVELERDGLPIDGPELDRLVAEAVGPRPRSPAEAAAARRQRDRAVLQHLPGGEASGTDLRNPTQVREALRGVGIEVPDTRSWRLEPWREHHPLVAALLAWRKSDRIATTYGYDWIDRHIGADGRLRGDWQASDGAAGRMTAGAGLHNLPAELRSAVAAPPGQVLVRADLGQVEPRVLAAVSADRALAAATAADDLYAPVAARLGVERAVAKVAVLAAMYGQTSGTAGEALKGLDLAYPVAMRYLRRASDAGRGGQAVLTHGGRRVPMWTPAPAADERQAAALAGARGRFARNAVVQGSAAELFKAWAVTVRSAAQSLGATVVLCLHDELLVLAPDHEGEAVAHLLHRTLDDVAAAWAPSSGVRFVADVRVVQRWSQAKG
ncbi:DNA polymerase [Angustibacter sp. Root456]|uniref:DNA polymerase n=1 Tax=Angustibacter sp. Root456 TaxID=1736539 RepID=UPI001F1B5398|nr:DNA polymerase [Angustibacter sp. Root456]